MSRLNAFDPTFRITIHWLMLLEVIKDSLMTNIPQTSGALDARERGESDPDDDGFPRVICLSPFLESGKMIDQDKLTTIMRRRAKQESDDSPSLRLVQKSSSQAG